MLPEHSQLMCLRGLRGIQVPEDVVSFQLSPPTRRRTASSSSVNTQSDTTTRAWSAMRSHKRRAQPRLAHVLTDVNHGLARTDAAQQPRGTLFGVAIVAEGIECGPVEAIVRAHIVKEPILEPQMLAGPDRGRQVACPSVFPGHRGRVEHDHARHVVVHGAQPLPLHPNRQNVLPRGAAVAAVIVQIA